MTRSSKGNTSKMARNLKTTPIAIIGIGSLFPQAHNTQDYWDNILRKIDCIIDVPPSRWSIEDYYDPNPAAPDKSYCKRGAFIPDIDFDPMEFGLPPNILEVTDVSQLISLVVAKAALEDAGYGEERGFNHENTGVILGVVGMASKLFTPLMTRLQYPVWEKVLRSAGVSEADTARIIEKIKLAYVGWEENAFPGAIGNVIAGRIANRFNLGGTNCVIDAACASSLAAIRMAVSELIQGRMDMMITGGVDTDNTINTYMCFSKTPAFSKGDRVRPFDAESDGMMVGEGLGMVVLKRLEDAERDGDRIYAVIKAIGTSSDGRFKSIYAPRPSGQALALRRAYEEAGFSPATVGLIEAHGTGTNAGDPAEFQGLNEVFSENNPRKQYIALGSVKSQIAHTKAAAGAASLIKTALALHHKVLPPTINVTRPNPKFDIENTPFYINTEARPWIRAKNGAPRRAGVSSFGFGGTNFHLVLEEYSADHQGPYRLNTVAQPVLLAAGDVRQLQAACRDALQQLQGDQAAANFDSLARASRDLEIPTEFARVGFVAESPEEARQLLQICIDSLGEKGNLESWEHPKSIYYRRSGVDPQGKVVALFSGQGSQYLEMGRELAVNFPVMREAFGEMDALFTADGLEPLSSRVYPKPVFDDAEREALSEALTRTEHAQPAIGTVSVGLYKLLQQAGFQPDFTAGHSFGELTALWAAGVLDDADYFKLAKARGKAMSPPDDPNFDAGTMAAVKGDVEKIREALKDDSDVTLANWNSNDQVVIAGSKPAMERAQQRLNEQGFKTIPLPVSAAFHTPLVGHAQKPFAEALRSVTFNPPKVRVYSNSTAQPHSSDPETIRTLMADHILNPVLFKDEIENIYAEGGSIFVEFGPKNVLTRLVENILEGRPYIAVALNASAKKDSDRQLREAVVALRVAGLKLRNFDPYIADRPQKAPRKLSPVAVKLNAGYYITEKTRSAFEKALNDGFKISAAQAPDPVAIPAPAPAAVPEPVIPQPDPSTMSTKPSADFENLLSEYQAHQSETLRLHEQYLRTEEEYARAFAQMTQLQTELVRKGSGASGELQSVIPLFESLERSMTRFHEHQAETLRIHQRYLETQEKFSQAFMQGISQAPAPQPAPAPARPVDVKTESVPVEPPANKNGNGYHPPAHVEAKPAPVPAAPPAPVEKPPVRAAFDHDQLKTALINIVSEKTGYPVETLELDMDMEADLGIDSIKRVEILGAMQAQFPELPHIETSALAELCTLGQIIDFMGANENRGEPVAAASAPAADAAPAAPAPAATSGGLDAAELQQALLQIVSEKTGYPVETLELDMDLEADLGIDSIKRVEILGAVQAQFPDLPSLDTSTLAELNTLGQIIEKMGSAPVLNESPVQETAQETSPAASAAPAAAVQAAGSVDGKALTTALLNIVSEKTGYPVETLELDMDMEADLGIDSIKRVEILGAMQAQFPDLPQVGTEELAELCTLNQIIERLNRAGGSPAGETSQTETGESPFDQPPFDPGVSQGVVIRKLLPAPDVLDFTIPEGYVALVTDDGTAVAPALAQALLDRNWPVVVMRLPEAVIPAVQPLPQGANSVSLQDLSESALQACLAEVAEKYGPVAAFIYLEPTGENDPSGVRFSELEKSLVKLAFLAAKHLKGSINQAAALGRSVFMTVTRLDGAFGLGEDGDYTPVIGGLFGLVKTLNLEWDAVFCRAVDLSPALSVDRAVDCILAELCDPNRLITEVGYTLDERSTLALMEEPQTAASNAA